MKKNNIKGKIEASGFIMLIGIIIFSSSISASELNKNFIEEKNIIKTIEKQPMTNLNSSAYRQIFFTLGGSGLIWLNGNGYLNLTTGYYNITFTRFFTGLRFISFSTGSVVIWTTSRTAKFITGQLIPAGISKTFHHGGNSTYVWIIGIVSNAFEMTGEIS